MGKNSVHRCIENIKSLIVVSYKITGKYTPPLLSWFSCSILYLKADIKLFHGSHNERYCANNVSISDYTTINVFKLCGHMGSLII